MLSLSTGTVQTVHDRETYEAGRCVGTRHFTDELTMLIDLQVTPDFTDLVV